MKRFTTSFAETTVNDKPSEWLPHYSHFFSKTLEPTVSASGRAFLTDRQMLLSGFDQFNTNNIRRTIFGDLFDPGHQERVMSHYTYMNNTDVDDNRLRTHRFEGFAPYLFADIDVLADFSRLFTEYHGIEGDTAEESTRDMALAEELQELIFTEPDWATSHHNVLIMMGNFSVLQLAVNNGTASADDLQQYQELQPEIRNIERQAIISRIVFDPGMLGRRPQTAIVFYDDFTENPGKYASGTGNHFLLPLDPADTGAVLNTDALADMLDVGDAILYYRRFSLTNNIVHHEYFKNDNAADDETMLAAVRTLVAGADWQADANILNQLALYFNTALQNRFYLKTLHFFFQ